MLDVSQLALNLCFPLNKMLTWFVNAFQGSSQVIYSQQSSITRVANANPHEVSRRQPNRQVSSRYMGGRPQAANVAQKKKENCLKMKAKGA